MDLRCFRGVVWFRVEPTVGGISGASPKDGRAGGFGWGGCGRGDGFGGGAGFGTFHADDFDWARGRKGEDDRRSEGGHGSGFWRCGGGRIGDGFLGFGRCLRGLFGFGFRLLLGELRDEDLDRNDCGWRGRWWCDVFGQFDAADTYENDEVANGSEPREALLRVLELSWQRETS